MWAEHKIALLVYASVICREWKARGFRDRLEKEFLAAYARLRPTIVINSYPPWFGLHELHASHRSNLLRKDSVHYGRFGWAEPDNLPYVWPINTNDNANLVLRNS